ncbi:hypothetical protein B0H10DRAFT_1990448, partial [Mycena sp. CBHHK59/15]
MSIPNKPADGTFTPITSEIHSLASGRHMASTRSRNPFASYPPPFRSPFAVAKRAQAQARLGHKHIDRRKRIRSPQALSRLRAKIHAARIKAERTIHAHINVKRTIPNIKRRSRRKYCAPWARPLKSPLRIRAQPSIQVVAYGHPTLKRKRTGGWAEGAAAVGPSKRKFKKIRLCKTTVYDVDEPKSHGHGSSFIAEWLELEREMREAVPLTEADKVEIWETRTRNGRERIGGYHNLEWGLICLSWPR